MWSLPRPVLVSQQVFELTISRMRDHKVFSEAAAAIQEAADLYDTATAAGLHDVPETSFQLAELNAKQMGSVYESGMVRIGSPGRSVYDKLILAPKYGKCPLCGERRVATLDHYLPKDKCWALAVVPLNLVPCCSDCNRAKGNRRASSADAQPLHPYYDILDGSTWLGAEVIHTDPVALKFSVQEPSSWSPVLVQRVKAHFLMFKLGRLYGSHASQELGDLAPSLELEFNTRGAEGVHSFLLEQSVIVSRGDHNSWRAAAYRALAEDQWFWSGGFRQQ